MTVLDAAREKYRSGPFPIVFQYNLPEHPFTIYNPGIETKSNLCTV